MLQAPIEGYEDAIVVPLINANNFELKQTLINLIVASLEDKLDIRMNRFEKSLNDMKNYFITPTVPLKAVAEPIICTACGSMVKGGLCLTCDFREKILYNCDPNAYSLDNSNHFPRPQYENRLCNLCGNNSHDGYDCQQQFPFVYEQGPSYNQNYDDQIQTPQYPEIHLSSQETSDKVFQANHSVQNEESSNEIAISNSNQEKEEPPQDSDIFQLIREECSTEVSEEQKQSMEDTMLDALNSKLLLINSNSQRLDKKEQEVKNVVEQSVERGNRNIQSLHNFRVVHKSSISSNTSQISSIHAIAPVLSTKKPEHLLSMRYKHLSITPETESDKVTESNAENLLPIPSKCEVTLEDKKECDLSIFENSPVCDDNSNTFSDSKIDDDISVYDDDFEDIEYVEASLSDPKNVSIEEENSVEEENIVQQEDEEVDFEDISQIQDVVLREKLLCIIRLISNIESSNDNFTPDHSEETRSGNTTHDDNSLPEYDSFCFEIEPDQERLIYLVKNNIPDDSSNDSLLEESDLFLASDNSIPPGIKNFGDDPERDIRFLEELLIDDFILSHESFDSNFEDNPSISRPPPEPPDAETDTGEEIQFVMINKDKFDDDYKFFMFDKVFSLLSAESEDMIFDPGISD
nr:hypothetical protein [Tanacetum cinerariifolium]